MIKIVTTCLFTLLSFSLMSQLKFDLCPLGYLDNIRDIDYGDLDNDGLIDLVGISSADNAIYALINNSIGYDRMLLAEAKDPRKIRIADLDNDGNLDVVAIDTSDNSLLIFENDVSSTLNFIKHEYNFGRYSSALAVSDINNDNLLDLVLGFGSGSVHVINEGDFIFSENESLNIFGFPQDLVVFDSNNDGFKDIIFADYNSLRMYLNSGNSLEFDEVEIDDVTSTLSIASGDVNNDGFVDVVVCSYLEGLALYYNSGQEFTKEIVDADFNLGTAIVLSDLDNDDDLEIVIIHEDESSLFYYENNNGIFNKNAIIEGAGLTGNTIRSFDFDNDNDQDILALSFWTGGIFLFKNTLLSSSVSTSESTSISIFPNPAQESIVVQTDIQVDFIKLYNSRGEMVLSSVHTEIDISQLPQGIYFVQLISDNEMSTYKFLKG